jgi:porphobilinogen synthase
MRELVSDVELLPKNLMLPIFVKEGITVPQPIKGLPNVVQHTQDSFLKVLDDAISTGILAVMFFAIPEDRDATGSQSCSESGILTKVVKKAKAHVGDRLVIVADLCLDEFTDHGHCGVLDSYGQVDNDATLTHYVEMSLVLAQSGVDLLGTSGMMDGQVRAIRSGLDEAGFINTGILAYSAKYASNFYGPFRNAVESQLIGDRKTYQQDYRRRLEGIEETILDLEQGADIVMVKPALAYLDVIAAAAQISKKPVAAYLVSGEYAMVETAAQAGIFNRDETIFELLFAVRRAGAQIICTYWALEFAQKIQEKNVY